ncbi:MAG: formate dehydrogenase-N subunit alpha [Planctomycetota bacterium]
MGISRRSFIGNTAAVGGLGFLGLNLSSAVALADGKAASIKRSKITTTICPYCAVGCGAIVMSETRDGHRVVTNLEGDPDHPISEGALCPKGSSLRQLTDNDKRLKQVLYRAPGASDFVVKDWKWAAKEIALKIKKTRDADFELKNAKGETVNRVKTIASVGSAALDNEECWLYQKFLRCMGLVNIEHQARLCHSSTVTSLAASFGRGAMTNHWIDLKNSDCVIIMGANPAENHPVSFKWVLRAKDKGAKIIHVDPRFTRTSALADVYARLRSGTDIAFLGGMIKFILDNDLIHKDYVVNYTNAALVVKDGFNFDAVAGLFSDYNAEKRRYSKESWQFQTDANGEQVKDSSLQNPRCVYQLLKQHYSRYDLKKVSSVTGTPIEDLQRVYETFAATGAPDKVGTIMYAMGWTQHTVGVQNIRAMSLVQLLLGNIGRAGGGVNAMRGEANVQGACDHGLLFNILPGYLKIPTASLSTLDAYLTKHTPKAVGKQSANWWGNYPKYAVSFLKSTFGAAATKENGFGYEWLPKIDDGVDHSWLTIFDEMLKGNVKGFFAWGQNPACSSANAVKTRQALTKLDWMVNVNIFPSETGWFFQDQNLCEADTGKKISAADIKTAVFVLPAAVSVEKEGSLTNSGRWMQWRYKASDPLGESKPDADIMNLIYQELKKLYATEGGAFPEPILKLKWDYFDERGDFLPHVMGKEINGYFVRDVTIPGTPSETYKAGELVPAFAKLQADGSTSSGSWIYCGSYTNDGNMAARRKRDETDGLGLHPKWAWSWPVNRRILYNRASVDPQGQPYDPKRAVITWKDGKWIGDVPDGPWPPPADAEKGRLPFIMTNDGFGRLFSSDLADGPFPEHYEPLESPLTANPFNGQMLNPAARVWSGPADLRAACGSSEYPYVCSTYRVTEHWQTGVMTRHTPWLLELQPEVFVEMSLELAREKNIKAGDLIKIWSKRGKVIAVAMPTLRLKPFTIQGKTVHQVGLPWHFGWVMPRAANNSMPRSANRLTPTVGDANTQIPEFKAFLVNIAKLDAGELAAMKAEHK